MIQIKERDFFQMSQFLKLKAFLLMTAVKLCSFGGSRPLSSVWPRGQLSYQPCAPHCFHTRLWDMAPWFKDNTAREIKVLPILNACTQTGSITHLCTGHMITHLQSQPHTSKHIQTHALWPRVPLALIKDWNVMDTVQIREKRKKRREKRKKGCRRGAEHPLFLFRYKTKFQFTQS